MRKWANDDELKQADIHIKVKFCTKCNQLYDCTYESCPKCGNRQFREAELTNDYFIAKLGLQVYGGEK